MKSVFTKALKEKTKILLDQKKKIKQTTYKSVTERSEVHHFGGNVSSRLHTTNMNINVIQEEKLPVLKKCDVISQTRKMH